MDTNFAINHHLDLLPDQERKAYLDSLSAFVGLDPKLNAFDMIWKSNRGGGRNLIAYARRGTTELLRALHGINMILCEDLSTPQLAKFIVAGTDKTGRQEFAVGTSPLVGLSGEDLASAVMTANTRANRRLTLQFVGCGLYDESEVDENFANPASAAKPVAVALPAVYTTNTPALPAPPVKVEVKSETPEEFEARTAQLRADATAALTTAAPPAEPKKKHKKRSNTVSIDSPAAPAPIAAVAEFHAPTVSSRATLPLHSGSVLRIVEPPAQPLVEQPKPVTQAPAVQVPQSVQVAPPAPVGPPPVTPQPAATTNPLFETYRVKLREIVHKLEAVGFKATPGVGGPNIKMKKFAILQSGGTDALALTKEQWDDLFEFFSEYDSNPAGLMAYIDKALTPEVKA